ncbi:hypothetical protein AB9T88_09865, partial [Flavobacterium sp. LBUM151]
YEIMEFNSADEVTSYAKGIDFNWMVSEKTGNHKLQITQTNQNCSAEMILLFSLQTTLIKINEKPYDLEPYDLLVIENQKKENIMLHFSNKCLYGTLESLSFR